MVRMYAFLPVVAILGTLLPCVAAGADRDPSALNPRAQTIQVILKYRDPEFNPAAGDYLRKVAAETGTNILYVRRMSGDAHVLRIEVTGNAEGLRRAIDRIAARPEVEWVEQDRLLRHQSR